MTYHLLLVDDDPLISQALRTLLPPEWKLISVQDPSYVNANFLYHAAFVDMHLTGKLDEPIGLDVIKKLKDANPLLEAFAISGDLNRELMEDGLKVGAKKFLPKPLSRDEVLDDLAKVEALVQIRLAATKSGNHPKWVGTSAASEKIRKDIAILRGEPGPILISGESGTGKEVAARLLNAQEGARTLISVNMASIPENLFESELFGHIKGAFTGADQNKVGLIEAATGGDLFLDEIEALPLVLQAKLLRFLESGEIKKVGAKETQIVNCRVICATNRDLFKMVEKQEFREDLYWRISGKKISLASLKERIDDVPELAKHFLENDKPRRNKSFSEDGIRALKEHSWPGNVRELKRVTEQLSLTSPLPIIRADDVLGFLKASDRATTVGQLDFSLSLAEMVERFEAQVIRQAVQIAGGVDKAVELLKTPRSTLYKKIKDYQIETKD